MQYKQNSIKLHGTPIQITRLQVQGVIKHSKINNWTDPDKVNSNIFNQYIQTKASTVTVAFDLSKAFDSAIIHVLIIIVIN